MVRVTMMTEHKIKSQDEIKKVVEKFRKDGKTIVTTNGSFDILHAGHIAALEESKAQGDILIIGLNSDASVKAYKNPWRPIISEEHRARMLAALECVDYVVLFDEPEAAAPLIRLVRPHIHANGANYGTDCVETPAIQEVGGKLYMYEIRYGLSTSEIIKKIIDVREKEMNA